MDQVVVAIRGLPGFFGRIFEKRNRSGYH